MAQRVKRDMHPLMACIHPRCRARAAQAFAYLATGGAAAKPTRHVLVDAVDLVEQLMKIRVFVIHPADKPAQRADAAMVNCVVCRWVHEAF